MNQQELDRLTTQMNLFMEGRKLFPPSKSDELAELGVKRCPKCTTVKSTTEFCKVSSRRDGLDNKCKACNRANVASYKEVNPEYDHNRYRDPESNHRLNKQLHNGYRRAIEAGNTAVRITPEELLAHWKSVGIDPLVCYLTGEPLDHLSRSIDHIDAISNGGEHNVTNLAPSTAEANFKKNNVTPEEARELLSA